jgi:hypothetical protein
MLDPADRKRETMIARREANMRTMISPEIEGNPELATAIRQANELLRGELGPSEPVVTAQWTLTRDIQHRPLIGVEVSDPMASARAQLLPEELGRNGDRLQARLRRLWDRVLEIRSDKLMERITQKARELEGE